MTKLDDARLREIYATEKSGGHPDNHDMMVMRRVRDAAREECAAIANKIEKTAATNREKEQSRDDRAYQQGIEHGAGSAAQAIRALSESKD